jgi:hypothetical protein
MPKTKHTGQPGDCSPEQEKCLAEIRDYVESTYSHFKFFTIDDWFLLRFCRARDFKPKKIKLMLDGYFEFHQTHDVGNNLQATNKIPEYTKILSDNIHKSWFGFCKDGTPFEVESRNCWDDKNIVNGIPVEPYKQIFIKSNEDAQRVVLPIASKLAGRRIDKYSVIFDLKDASIKQFFQTKIRDYLKIETLICEQYYPESLGKIWVLNCPWYINAVYALIKPMLAKETKKKINILGSDYAEELAKDIDLDQLPQFIGGAKVDEYPNTPNPFQFYLDECEKQGTYVLEPALRDDPNWVPPSDPWERAKTICSNPEELLPKMSSRTLEGLHTVKDETAQWFGGGGFAPRETIQDLFDEFGSKKETGDYNGILAGSGFTASTLWKSKLGNEYADIDRSPTAAGLWKKSISDSVNEIVIGISKREEEFRKKYQAKC